MVHVSIEYRRRRKHEPLRMARILIVMGPEIDSRRNMALSPRRFIATAVAPQRVAPAAPSPTATRWTAPAPMAVDTRKGKVAVMLLLLLPLLPLQPIFLRRATVRTQSSKVAR